MDGDASKSPGMKLRIKKIRLYSNFKKCIKCQRDIKGQKLQIATTESISKFIEVAKLRNDTVFERMEAEINENILTAGNVKWHKSCYASYTSVRNIAHAEGMSAMLEDEIPGPSSSVPQTRRSHTITNWSLCLICQQTKYKGERETSQVQTTQICETLMKAAQQRKDEDFMRRILGEDLIAQEAKYHRGCYKKYTSLAACSTKGEASSTILYDDAFVAFIQQIEDKLFKEQRAFEMSNLLDIYQEKLKYQGISNETAAQYKIQNLKKRLISKYGDQLMFLPQRQKNMSEIVCSGALNIGELINNFVELKEMRTWIQDATENEDTTDTATQVLYHAVAVLRSDMRDIKGIEINPLNIEDISVMKAKEIVPEKLKFFLQMLLQPEKHFAGHNEEMTEGTERKVLSIAQDIISQYSGGRKKMPKNVGLGLAIRNLVRGKEIITMLNRNGHSINYWECEQIDTSWATSITETFKDEGGIYKAVVPSNILPGQFVQSAADNADFLQDTPTGRDSVHVMSMAFYQRGFALSPEALVHKPPSVASVKKRALEATCTKLMDFNFSNRKAKPTIVQTVTTEFFEQSTREREALHAIDRAWIFARNTPTKLLGATIVREKQVVPGWSGFNAIVARKHNEPTRIGFPPMIPASVKDKDTVYTCLKSLDRAFTKDLGQRNPVITFDEDLYARAKQTQWAVSPELDHLVIRLGGFHRAKNFLGVIGKKMADSGLEDIWLESDVYGSNVVSKITNGVHYNRAVRAHKLMVEALESLKWEGFIQWMEDKNLLDSSLKFKVTSKLEDLLSELQNSSEYLLEHKEHVHDLAEGLATLLTEMKPLFDQFITEGCDKSATFHFWEDYVQMVWLLLDFIRADRLSDWKLHLEAFRDMLIYDAAFDHLNYLKWGIVYMADMSMLPSTAPEVEKAFSEDGLHAVSRAPKPSFFNAVAADMALEQMQNCDAKSKGGLTGISNVQESRDRWALTAHLMAAVTHSFKAICGMETGEQMHKDLGKSQLEADASDVKKIKDCILENMENPFDTSKFEGEKLPLLNIATGAVAPADVTSSLLGSFGVGKAVRDNFVEERLVKGTKNFWEPMKKSNIKTFASLRKPLKLTKEKQMVTAVNIDRQIFSRFVVVSEKRDIDLKEVHTHELAQVPLSLANMDGTLKKTPKSVLLKELGIDSQAMSNLPSSEKTSGYIVDLMAVVQMTPKGSMLTFGDFSEALAQQIICRFKDANEVHVVPDRYDIEDSIKGGERDRRYQGKTVEIKIRGRATKLPSSLRSYLSSNKNKTNLIQFLISDWCVTMPGNLNKGQTLCIGTLDGKAIWITSQGYSVCPQYECDHEEADSRIFVHCELFAKLHAGQQTRVVIYSPDTDVAVLCCYHFAYLALDELWFHTPGRQKRYMPVHAIANNIGPRLCDLLPALHALSGCDSISSVSGTGKKKALQVLKDNLDALQNLSDFGSQAATVEPDCMEASKLTIGLFYGEKSSDLNALRYKLFTKKNLDSTKLPPTDDAATLHIKRANYQCYIWKYARNAMLHLPSPIGNGWKKDDQDRLVPELMTKPPAPETIIELVVCGCTKGCGGRCSCRQVSLPCTAACKCDGSCSNQELIALDDDDV